MRCNSCELVKYSWLITSFYSLYINLRNQLMWAKNTKNHYPQYTGEAIVHLLPTCLGMIDFHLACYFQIESTIRYRLKAQGGVMSIPCTLLVHTLPCDGGCGCQMCIFPWRGGTSWTPTIVSEDWRPCLRGHQHRGRLRHRQGRLCASRFISYH